MLKLGQTSRVINKLVCEAATDGFTGCRLLRRKGLTVLTRRVRVPTGGSAGHDRLVEPLDLAEVFVTFLALLGPQKVLLSFGQVVRETEPATGRRVAVFAGLSAAVIGVVLAEAAPWLTGFFHVSRGSMELEGGIILFVYAAALVLGIHLGVDGQEDEEADPAHPIISGYRELLIPFVVSPLGLTGVLVQALSGGSWGWRGTVAIAYAAVCILNLVCMLVLAGVMRYVHTTALDVLSRLLGLLLAGVGVELVLHGLATLDLLHAHAGH